MLMGTYCLDFQRLSKFSIKVLPGGLFYSKLFTVFKFSWGITDLEMPSVAFTAC